MNYAKTELTIDKQLVIIIASGVVGLLVIWLAAYAALTFVPIVLSFMLASSLDPVLARLEAMSMQRVSAIFLLLSNLIIFKIVLKIALEYLIINETFNSRY